jgi:hypothetical protein
MRAPSCGRPSLTAHAISSRLKARLFGGSALSRDLPDARRDRVADAWRMESDSLNIKSAAGPLHGVAAGPGAVSSTAPMSSGGDCCPSCGQPHQVGAVFCASCGVRLPEARTTSFGVAPSNEVSPLAMIGRVTALAVMVVGQIAGVMLWLVIGFTSGKPLLFPAAFFGLVGYVTMSWLIRRDHAYPAALLTLGGTAALSALLVLANSQGWLGA